MDRTIEARYNSIKIKMEVNKIKLEKIDHVSIYVRDLEKARRFFAELLDAEFSDVSQDKELDTRGSMGPAGIELIAPLTPDGPVARAIDKRGEGLSLVSLKVPNLEQAVAEMQSRGVRLAAKIEHLAVFHPKDTYGVMFEFIEK